MDAVPKQAMTWEPIELPPPSLFTDAAHALLRPSWAVAQGEVVIAVSIRVPRLYLGRSRDKPNKIEDDEYELASDEVAEGIPEDVVAGLQAAWRRYAEGMYEDKLGFKRIRVISKPKPSEYGITLFLVASVPASGVQTRFRVPEDWPDVWMRLFGWPAAPPDAQALVRACKASDLYPDDAAHLGRPCEYGPLRLGDVARDVRRGDSFNVWIDAGSWGLQGARARPSLGPCPPPPPVLAEVDSPSCARRPVDLS